MTAVFWPQKDLFMTVADIEMTNHLKMDLLFPTHFFTNMQVQIKVLSKLILTMNVSAKYPPEFLQALASARPHLIVSVCCR